MKKILCVLLFAGFTTMACAPISGSREAAVAVAQIRATYNDDKAAALMLAVCDMSLGAANRIGDGEKRKSLDVLCGGRKAGGLSNNDIKTLVELYEVLSK